MPCWPRRNKDPGYAARSGPQHGSKPSGYAGGFSAPPVACHDAVMLPCAAYLRIYEPLAAFGPAERAQWAGYAASAGRPRRVNALAQEHAESLRRLIALPPIVA